jgi:small subunit ribosomal protein S16
MAVRIRMTRAGSKRKPFYRFVVIDSNAQRDGGFLDWVGQYNPIAKPYDIKVDEAKIAAWLGKGATLSEGVRSILKKSGILMRLKGGAAEAGEAVQAAAAEAGGAEAAAHEEAAPESAEPGAQAEETGGGEVVDEENAL